MKLEGLLAVSLLAGCSVHANVEGGVVSAGVSGLESSVQVVAEWGSDPYVAYAVRTGPYHKIQVIHLDGDTDWEYWKP